MHYLRIFVEFAQACVPVKTVDNARSDLDTSAEIAAYVEQMASGKLVNEGGCERQRHREKRERKRD
jgi:hypothetical protein